MSDTLALVISYNGFFYTRKTIQYLEQQTHLPDIAVWDNCSSDATPLWLATQPQIQSYISDKNVLWTPAINAGIQRFWNNQKYILVLNNDILLAPTTLERMIRYFDDETVGMVGPLGANLGGPQDYAAHYGERPVSQWEQMQNVLDGNPPVRVTYIIGACMLFRKDIYDIIGAFDESMPLGADDHDYSLRIRRAGYKLLVAQDSYAFHIGHASGYSSNWNEYGQKGWEAFEAKHYASMTDEQIANHWDGYFVEGVSF